MGKKYDFCGWATKNDLLCSDGRTIRKDAFKECDGLEVPLVWNHQHGSVDNVLGHALLENRDEGVYAYGYFNSTESGKAAKTMVDNGDIKALSIYANKLKQKGGDVLHGVIRELSLVLAGANPGAFIDSVIEHGEYSDDSAIIYTGEELSFSHSDEEEKMSKEDIKKEDEIKKNEEKDEEKDEEKKDDKDPENNNPDEEKKDDKDPEKKKPEDEEIEHADGETVKEIFDTMSDKQKDVVYFMIGQALADAEDNKNDKGEDETMKHNAFEDAEGKNVETNVITHADMAAIIEEAQYCGSLKLAVESRIASGEMSHSAIELKHDGTYGVDNIDYLFPDAKVINTTPDFIQRNMAWVGRVQSGVHRTPFSRIKSVHANITADEARAKGYIKGKRKKEEVFPLLKRTTTPQTVYKKQKLDKDDIDDITDFDVVMWIRNEMKMMLDEELSRAYLIGDGREYEDEDKIKPEHIRPIWTDDDLYTIKAKVEVKADDPWDTKCNAFIDATIVAQEDYEGTGSPVMFCVKQFLTRSLLMRNSIGERLYKNKQELADELGVTDIIPVDVFKNQTRTDAQGVERTLIAIVVNLTDYNVGSDKNGKVDMFDDFDIDFNQYKYLIETRQSGALIKPYSAIAVEMVFQ